MRAVCVAESGGQRTFVLVFDIGEEAVEGLQQFARRERITAASISAVGALRDATVAYFDWPNREYRHIPVNEQVEVLSLLGDVACRDGQAAIHAHAVLGRADGSTVGGHLIEAIVRPTLEVVLIESPAHLIRRFDPASNLALIDLDADVLAECPRD